MIHDCPICDLYTEGQGHDDHAAWRELATPDELTAITSVLGEHQEAHDLAHAADLAHGSVHKRAEAIVRPLHERCRAAGDQEYLAAHRARLTELAGGDLSALTAEQAESLITAARQSAKSATSDAELVSAYAVAAGLIIPDPWGDPPF